MSERTWILAIVGVFVAWYFLPALAWVRLFFRHRAALWTMQSALAEREARGVKREIERGGY